MVGRTARCGINPLRRCNAQRLRVACGTNQQSRSLVDIPGRALSLVVIDRIPFPHRNNPLLAARRDLHGAKGFTEIDLPRAITALAQATGRLIRTRTDKGVVAVLDPRLASKSYRWSIINALPPLKRIKDINEATEFLKEITQ